MSFHSTSNANKGIGQRWEPQWDCVFPALHVSASELHFCQAAVTVHSMQSLHVCDSQPTSTTALRPCSSLQCHFLCFLWIGNRLCANKMHVHVQYQAQSCLHSHSARSRLSSSTPRFYALELSIVPLGYSHLHSVLACLQLQSGAVELAA